MEGTNSTTNAVAGNYLRTYLIGGHTGHQVFHGTVIIQLTGGGELHVVGAAFATGVLHTVISPQLVTRFGLPIRRVQPAAFSRGDGSSIVSSNKTSLSISIAGVTHDVEIWVSESDQTKFLVLGTDVLGKFLCVTACFPEPPFLRVTISHDVEPRRHLRIPLERYAGFQVAIRHPETHADNDLRSNEIVQSLNAPPHAGSQ